MVNWQGIGNTYFPEYKIYFNVDDACNIWQRICDKNKRPDEILCNLFHQIVTTPSGWKKNLFGPGYPLPALAHRGLEMIQAKKIAVSDVDVARFYQWLAWMEEEEEEAAVVGRRPSSHAAPSIAPSLPHKLSLPTPLPTPPTVDPTPSVDQTQDRVQLGSTPPLQEESSSLEYVAPIAGGLLTLLAFFISAFVIRQLWGGAGEEGTIAPTSTPQAGDFGGGAIIDPPLPPSPPVDPLPLPVIPEPPPMLEPYGKEIPRTLRNGRTYLSKLNPRASLHGHQ